MDSLSLFLYTFDVFFYAEYLTDMEFEDCFVAKSVSVNDKVERG